jgi:hypothetical protein
MSDFADVILQELGDFDGWDFAHAGVAGSQQFFEEFGELTRRIQSGTLTSADASRVSSGIAVAARISTAAPLHG